MLKLFQSIDKNFLSNGDKIIIPLKAKVHKEDNGAFFLDLETNLDYINDLTEGKIIVAPTPQGDQAFRINNISKTRRKITAKCYHVYYDSKNYLIADSYVVDKNCNDALNHLNNATDNTSPFTVSSDITTIDSYRCVRNSLNEAIETVLERWGGHLVRDNFNISIMNTIGRDNGVTVRYAKNLKEIVCEENWDNVVTKLLPVGKDGILLNELDSRQSIYIQSQTQYALPYTKTVSFSQDINQEDYSSETAYKRALVNDLRVQAEAYLKENCVPQINYTLKANLERITDIGDTIVVIDERLGLDLTTHLISYEYDCILEKYTELEFGNFAQRLSNLVSDITSSVTTNTKQQIQTATDKIWNTLEDKIVITYGDKLLVLDSLPKEEAVNCFMLNKDGIGHSSSGINGTFTTVWSIDNKLNLDKINYNFGDTINYFDNTRYDRNYLTPTSNIQRLNIFAKKIAVVNISFTNTELLTANTYYNYITLPSEMLVQDNVAFNIVAQTNSKAIMGHAYLDVSTSHLRIKFDEDIDMNTEIYINGTYVLS